MGNWSDPYPRGQWCLAGWKSPRPHTYTGGCSCERQHGHPGAHRCDCGAKTTAKSALPSEEDML